MIDTQDTLASFINVEPIVAIDSLLSDWPAELPGPAFHHDIDYDTYAAWPALNATTMLWAMESMEHVKAAMDGLLTRDNKDMKFGREFHCRLLEPHIFKERFVVAEPCSAILTSGKNKGNPCGNTALGVDPDSCQWLCGQHSKSIDLASEEHALTQGQLESLDAMAAKVRGHKVVRLLRQHGGFECSGTWQCEGVPFKFRLDKLVDASSCPLTVIDLKKVRQTKLTTEAFMKHAFGLNYHIRAALQIDAVAKLKGLSSNDRRPEFIWIAVEDTFPHGVNIIRCTDKTYKIGKWQYLQLINQYKRCVESGVWPGVADDIQEGEPPAYIDKQFGFI